MALFRPYTAPTISTIEDDDQSPTIASTSSSLSVNLSAAIATNAKAPTMNPPPPLTTHAPTKSAATRNHREFSLAFKVNLLHELEQIGM